MSRQMARRSLWYSSTCSQVLVTWSLRVTWRINHGARPKGLEYLFFVSHHWLQTYSTCLIFRIRKQLNLIYVFDPGFTDLFVWIKMLLDKNYEKHEWKMKSHLNIKWCLEYYIGFPVLLSFLQRFHWWARVWSTFYCLLASRKRLYIKIAIMPF